MGNLSLTYEGIVEQVEGDSEEIGRLKVRVPGVYGPANAQENSVPTSQIPWAKPVGLPAGGTPTSGAMVWLPNVGDPVCVRFLDGEPEKPMWEWGSQTRAQAKNYPYWRKPEAGYKDGKPPDSTYFTRYGHSIDIGPNAVLVSTSFGYALTLTDASADGGTYGMVQLLTSKGYQFELDDNEDKLTIFVPNISCLFELGVMKGTRFMLTADELVQVITSHLLVAAGEVNSTVATVERHIVGGAFSVAAPHVALGTEFAVDPVVRLSDLLKVCNALMTYVNRHTHIGNLGKPTSPPITPLVLIPTGSKITFSA